MHHETFNANFYVAAATVIPIFFLALTLQGTFSQKLTTLMSEGSRGRKKVSTSKQALAILAACLLYLVCLAGLLGEGTALRALYDRTPPSDETAGLVYFSVVGLVGLVGFFPLWKMIEVSPLRVDSWARNWQNVIRKLRRIQPQQTPSESQNEDFSAEYDEWE